MSNKFTPRNPYTSSSGRKTTVSTTREDEVSDSVKSTTEQKTKVEHKEKHTAAVPVAAEHCEKKVKKSDNCDTGFSCSWLLWIFVIFIFVFLIVVACFWFARPSWVTKGGRDSGDTDDDSCNKGECEVDICKALLYAFFITFFIVIFFGAIWWLASRCC